MLLRLAPQCCEHSSSYIKFGKLGWIDFIMIPVPSLVASDMLKSLSVSSTADSVAHTRTIPSPSLTLSMAETDTVTSADTEDLK